MKLGYAQLEGFQTNFQETESYRIVKVDHEKSGKQISFFAKKLEFEDGAV